MSATPPPPDVLAAGWTIKVHGWRKLKNGRWECREIDAVTAATVLGGEVPALSARAREG